MSKQAMIKTELGLLPSDWKIVQLSDVGTFSKGAGISREDAKTGRIPAVRYGELYTTHDNYIYKCTSFISPEIAKTSKKIRKGSILFTGSGETKEDIGKAVAFINDYEAYAGGDIIILSPKKDYESLYLGFILNSLSIVRQRASFAQGDSVVHITANAIKQFRIPIPLTKDEQKRIATALYDIDTLIRNLDRTIEKKKNIRQGAMEQLLSGKKRLPGFKREWTEFVFDNIFKSISTRGKEIEVSDYLPTGKYPIIDQGKEQVVGYTNYSQPIMAKGGGYLVFGDHTRIFKYISRDFYVGADGTKVLECKDGYYPAFMFYKCLLLNIPNTGYNRHFVYLKESAFYIPTDIKEQYAIADTLTAMDDEIAVLQMERDKYANIRSGMMDDLLTGAKRL